MRFIDIGSYFSWIPNVEFLHNVVYLSKHHQTTLRRRAGHGCCFHSNDLRVSVEFLLVSFGRAGMRGFWKGMRSSQDSMVCGMNTWIECLTCWRVDTKTHGKGLI